MKHLLIFVIITTIFINLAYGQRVNTDTSHAIKSYSYYMQKRNTNNTIGWVCLGTGLTMGALGLLIDIGSGFNHGSSTKGDAIAVAGEVVALASIPFFISAHHNKKKALVYVRNGAITMNKYSLYKPNYLTVSLATKL